MPKYIKNIMISLTIIALLFTGSINTFSEDNSTEQSSDDILVLEDSSETLKTPKEYQNSFNSEILQPSPRIYPTNGFNMAARPRSMATLESQFDSWLGTVGSNEMDLWLVDSDSRANALNYRTSKTAFGRLNSTVQRRTLKDSIDLNKDFLITMGTMNTSPRNGNSRGIASAITLYNGAYNHTVPPYTTAANALPSLAIGGIPDSISTIQISPNNFADSSNFQSYYDATDSHTSRYQQVFSTNGAGKLKKESDVLPIPFGGTWVSSGSDFFMQPYNTYNTFKYVAEKRRLEIFTNVPYSTASNGRKVTLEKTVQIPSTWSSLRLSWSNATQVGTSGDGVYSTLGWFANSGYQDLRMPIKYRDADTNQDIYSTTYKDWVLSDRAENLNTLTNSEALSYANDDIRNNYDIVSITSQAVNVDEALAGQEGTYNLQNKPIYVYVRKKPTPTYKNVVFNAYSVNEDIPLANHETKFGDVIFQDRTLTIPYAQQTVDMGTISDINTFKSQLNSNGYDITKIVTFQQDGLTAMDLTTDSAIPAISPDKGFGFQNVIYWYKARESTINVQFVNELGQTLANAVSIPVKVPDKTYDLTKNQAVQNTLTNLLNNDYSIESRPDPENAIPITTTPNTVKYVLKKNVKQKSTIVDPSDGETPFTPKTTGGGDAQQNTTTEDIRIQYVSDFDFGVHSKGTSKIEALSAADRGVRQNESSSKDVVSFVSIIDDQTVKTKWKLKVSASGPFKNTKGQELAGASIKLSNLNYQSPGAIKPVAVSGTHEILQSGPTLISYANATLPLNSWSLGFGNLTNDKQSSGVQLVIPQGTLKDMGQYKQIINWELETGSP